MLQNDYEITSMTPARDPKQHFGKPLGKYLGAIWENFGSHLGSIWELEAEEAFFFQTTLHGSDPSKVIHD